ncbi:MAG: LPP20 family lipoprotein [Nitrospira sp.]|nr:LPP20 family lipoprotein [Nitrospira sp.]MCP9442957.1 LPP20 family lipoprotein [Nitrospira sp.]
MMLPCRIRLRRSVLRSVLTASCIGLIGPSWPGCAWIGGQAGPAWIDDANRKYPPTEYLTGMGQADNRQGAADQAYAAVARIFKAEVDARAKDWESYFLVERRGSTSEERRLALETVTNISTTKVLENVRIMETWYDQARGVYYALAVLNRAQAEASLLDRLSALDRMIESDIGESRRTSDKVITVRNLRKAARNLVLREVYNADLRVVRPSGRGEAAPYDVNDISKELARFLATSLVVGVRMVGDHAEVAQHALMEGLIREGITVTAGAGEGMDVALTVRGVTRLLPVEVHDPYFKYVRWCGDVEVVDTASGRVLGVVSRGGKEGHLTEREAATKALREMQRHLSSEVAVLIAAHIFGEAELPAPEKMPAGCPRDELFKEMMP